MKTAASTGRGEVGRGHGRDHGHGWALGGAMDEISGVEGGGGTQCGFWVRGGAAHPPRALHFGYVIEDNEL